MKEKIIRFKDPEEKIYSVDQLELLRSRRKFAVELLNIFSAPSLLYGSTARGDVHSESDIDIVFLLPIESFLVEIPLVEHGFEILSRELVQANPNSIPKGHFHIENNITVTVPLFLPTPTEEEFYRFGGAVNIEELRAERRVPGVTKQLLFIEPTQTGHIESSVIGQEVEVSRKLGLSLDTVNERVRVLSRRDKIGRTGVYLKEEIGPDMSFEATWKYLVDRDPVLRRQLKIRKK